MNFPIESSWGPTQQLDQAQLLDQMLRESNGVVDIPLVV